MIEDHAFRARRLWDNLRQRYFYLPHECGHVLGGGPGHATMVDDIDHCGRPPLAHALCYGTRWEPPAPPRPVRLILPRVGIDVGAPTPRTGPRRCW